MTRTITIVVREGNDFDIHEGEKYVRRLCWDEMLGSIAEITHPELCKTRYPMLTADEHQARDDRQRARREEIRTLNEQEK